MFAALELCLVFNKIRIDFVRGIMVNQPAVNHSFPVTIGIYRSTKNLRRMQRRSGSQSDFDSIEILYDLLIFAHVVFLVVIEDLFLRHFAIQDISPVRFVNDN